MKKIIRKIISSALCLTLIMTMVLQPFALPTSGLEVDGEISWSFDEDTGTLTISGSGNMDNYSNAQSAPWHAYRASIVKVEIGEGVQSIASYAFPSCHSLTEITISNTVKTIGDWAFFDCSNLTEITIPDAVETIGDLAFNGCFNMIKATIGAGIINIGQDAFTDYNYSELLEMVFTGASAPTFSNPVWSSDSYIGSHVTIAYVPRGTANGYMDAGFSEVIEYSNEDIGLDWNFNEVTKTLTISGYGSMDTYANPWYAYRDSIVKVQIGNGVQSIAPYAFFGYHSLTEITIPDTVTTIGSSAFSRCSSLTAVTIPRGVTAIEDNTFTFCNRLTEITIPETVTKIGSFAFGGCSGLAEIIIPETVTTIESSAFGGCSNLTKIIIPSGVKAIKEDTFNNCSSLMEIAIPDSVTTIGDRAFFGCSSMQKVTIGTGIRNIGEQAFYYTNKGELSVMAFTGENAPVFGSDSINPVTIASVPSGTASGYDGKGFAEIVEYSDEEIGVEWNFDENTGTLTMSGSGNMGNYSSPQSLPWYAHKDLIVKVEIGDGVQSIAPYAFEACSNLTEITIPNTVTTIGSGAFAECSSLTEITIPEAVTRIGGGTFANCSNLKAVIIPSGVTEIEGYAFYNCSNLKAVTIPSGVTAINDHTFYGCRNLTEITIPDVVTRIGRWAFAECSSLTEMIIPDIVTTIGESAFFGCSNLAAMTIPSGVTAIEGYTFYDCSSLTEIIIPETVTTIGVGAFYDCSNLVTVTIPSGVTIIGSGAFYDCSNLTAMTIPDTVMTIGNGAFGGCNNLKVVTMPSGLTAIESETFIGCRSLTEITIPDTVTIIGIDAFAFCSSLTEIIIPDIVTTIGESAFYGCSNLKAVTIPSGVTAIEGRTFADCSSLTEIIIPDMVTTIGREAFVGCSSLTEIIIPDKVTTIGREAFAYCSNLRAVIIPETVTAIDYEAFYNCSKLASIWFGSELSTVSIYAFDSCTGVEELIFESTAVPSWAAEVLPSFSSKLRTVYAPETSLEIYKTALSPMVGADVEIIPSDAMGMQPKNFRAEKVYSHTAVLSWTNYVNATVSEYVIMRGGEEIARVSDTSYTDRSLETGVHYTYSIYGVTEKGHETRSAYINVTTAAPQVTDISTDEEENRISLSNNAIHITVVNTKNHLPLYDEKTIGMLYYYANDTARTKHLIGEAELETATLSESHVIYTVRWDVAELADGEYTVEFVITDVDGVSAAKESLVMVDAERSVPETIVDVQAAGDRDGITITWSIATDMNTNGYKIYRCSENEESFRVIENINSRTILMFRDTTVNADSLYYYYVVGVNGFGLESAPSNIAVGEKKAAEEPPEPPEEVTLESIEITIQPTKTEYEIGESMDLTGLVVTGTYSDGSQKVEEVDADDVSGFNSSEVGELTLTITINGKTAKFTVTVLEAVEPTKPQKAAPAAPTLAHKTENTITLNIIPGAEYRLGEEGAWQKSVAFGGLTPETGYIFYARLVGDENQEASPASQPSAVITTDKATSGNTPPSGGDTPPSGGGTSPSGNAGRGLTVTDSSSPAVTAPEAPDAAASTIPDDATPRESRPAPSNPFQDVSATDWFSDDVSFVYAQGLFNGQGAYTFGPNALMNRAMLVTVLHRLGGELSIGGISSFSDVATAAYYAAAVAWAENFGIVTGVGGGLFAPNAEITRQDLAVMLLNYVNKAGLTLPNIREYSGFADADRISSYALLAVEALYEAGIINGRGAGAFDPRGAATRAEVAAMLHRFVVAARP